MKKRKQKIREKRFMNLPERAPAVFYHRKEFASEQRLGNTAVLGCSPVLKIN